MRRRMRRILKPMSENKSLLKFFLKNWKKLLIEEKISRINKYNYLVERSFSNDKEYLSYEIDIDKLRYKHIYYVDRVKDKQYSVSSYSSPKSNLEMIREVEKWIH